MAKGTRSGLGKGLGALINGSYGETMAAPIKDAPKRERILVDASDLLYEDAPKPVETAKKEETKVSQEEAKRKDALESVPTVGEAQRAEAPTEAPKAAPTEEIAPEIAAEKAEEVPTETKPEEIKAEIPAKLPEELPVDIIAPNPEQPRSNFKKEEMKELAASIARDGVIQPILVRATEDGNYQIVAGERRWQAAKLAGLASVPVRIVEADADKALELALIENVQRSDLNPIEEAYGYKRIIERQGITQTELATMLGKGRSTIANALRLLDLPEIAQQLLYEDRITAGHARAILSVPTKEGREKLTAKILNDKLNVRAAEQLARLYSGTAKEEGEPKEKPEKPSSYRAVAKSLKTLLDAPVKVKTAGGKNKIEIEFKDEEDLERIFRTITSK